MISEIRVTKHTSVSTHLDLNLLLNVNLVLRSFDNCADSDTPLDRVSFKDSFLYWLTLLLNYRGGKFKVVIFFAKQWRFTEVIKVYGRNSCSSLIAVIRVHQGNDILV